MPNARFYSSTAAVTNLQVTANPGDTSIQVASSSGFPGSFPFTLSLDYGSANEELVDVQSGGPNIFTVTRAVDGTSASTHNAGAVVRHVSSARDFTESRTHEASTSGVHGVTGTFVDTDSIQTLINKTLTAPVINNPTIGGTIQGSPTWDDAVTFNSNSTFTSGATFNSSTLVERALSTDNAYRARVTGDTNSRFVVDADGDISWGPGNATMDTNLYRLQASVLQTDDQFSALQGFVATRGATTSSVFGGGVTGDGNPRINVRADGQMQWGPGSGAADVTLSRSGSGVLSVAGALNATNLGTTGDLTVTGNLTVGGIGEVLFRRKTGDTPRSTATLSNDPHLTVTLAANAVYEMEALLHFYQSALGTDINIDWTAPASATGRWTGFGQPVTGPGGEVASTNAGYIRTVNTNVDAARTYGANTDTANPLSLYCKGLVITGGSGGTYALSWARNGAAGTTTMLEHSTLTLIRRA